MHNLLTNFIKQKDKIKNTLHNLIIIFLNLEYLVLIIKYNKGWCLLVKSSPIIYILEINL